MSLKRTTGSVETQQQSLLQLGFRSTKTARTFPRFVELQQGFTSINNGRFFLQKDIDLFYLLSIIGNKARITLV